MADATDVQAGEISLDDFMSDEQEAPKAESSTAEDKKPEPKTDAEEPKGEEPKDPETPDPVKPEGEAEKEEPQTKADERKEQLNAEIRDLVAQRNTLKEAIKNANAQVYQPATEEELVQEGMSATEAKVEALRQEMQVRDFNDKVADAQLTIESESIRVLNDFPAFNPDSPEYDKDLANEAATLLQANLIFDQNTGQVIGSNVSPYQLYKTLARASSASAVKGQLKGQQDTERMLANADTQSSAAPPKKASDPLMELWESDD